VAAHVTKDLVTCSIYSNKIKTPESSILGNANKIKPIVFGEKTLLNIYPVKSEYYDHNDHIIPENRICNES
jgi:hypothetical protein